MQPLTHAATLFNTEATGAKSPVGFGDSNTVPGAQAPKVLSGAFRVYAPEGFFNGCAHWETFGSAGLLGPRFANPVCAVTIGFGESWCPLLLIQFQDNIMNAESRLPPGTPEECYSITPAVFVGTTTTPHDAISVAANRSASLVRMMLLSLEADDQPATLTDLVNNLWLLEAELERIPEIMDAWLVSRRVGEV